MGLTDEQKKKISEAMKKKHAERRKLGVIHGSISPESKKRGGVLDQLKAERDELDMVIRYFERRGS